MRGLCVWGCSEGEREKRIVGKLMDTGKRLDTTMHAPDEVAVAWLLHHKAKIVPIIGTTTVARIRNQTVPAELIPFTDAHWDEINASLYYEAKDAKPAGVRRWRP
jgi:predicted oxidoreductase